MHTRHRKIYHHTFEYLVLLLLMLTGFFSFVKTAGSPHSQIKIGMLMAISYIVWGLIHHWKTQDLNWKVVIEYIAIAGLGVIFLWTLIVLVA